MLRAEDRALTREALEVTLRPTVSVLVPVLNERGHIGKTWSAMRDLRLDGEIEFLVIDGGSTDGTRDLLEQLAREDRRIRILDNPKGQTAVALNIGLQHAAGEFIARMDAHTVYPSDYLARGIARLRQGDVDWVSGYQIPYGDDTWSRRIALCLSSRLGIGGSRKWASGASDRQMQADRCGEVELDTGVFCGVWRRSTLEAHGGWDPGWPVNQDSELAARILAGGGRIVCLPELGARYVPRNSLAALGRQYWRYGQYRAKTARRHPRSMRASHLLPPGLILVLVAGIAGPKAVRRPARAALAGYACVLGFVSGRAALRSSPRDAAALPAVFALMHTAWGAGFLLGCLRFGPPLGALRRLVRPAR